MPVHIQTTGSVTVASLSGEIDHHLAAPMRAAIDAACTDNASRTLVLDFGGVTFMDSSGVGLVMGRFKLMQTLGEELILSNLPAPIRKVMRMAGLDRLAVIDQKSASHTASRSRKPAAEDTESARGAASGGTDADGGAATETEDSAQPSPAGEVLYASVRADIQTQKEDTGDEEHE